MAYTEAELRWMRPHAFPRQARVIDLMLAGKTLFAASEGDYSNVKKSLDSLYNKLKRKKLKEPEPTDTLIEELRAGRFAAIPEQKPRKHKPKVGPVRKHIMLPDMQVTPDSPTDHLTWIGQYIVEQRPEVIVCIGDFADMESLSLFDKGKRQFEGRRYIRDIDAARRAMLKLMAPIKEAEDYHPELHLTLGNHEYRIQRAIDAQAELDGVMGLMDLGYEDFGWTVHPFLKPVTIDGVSYAHYFSNPQSGRPYSGQSIDARLKNIGFSFTMGHQQVYMTGERPLNNGKRIRGLVWGAAYLHDEDYRGYQANSERRGIAVKHEVRDGMYDLMEVSLDFLCRKYEGCHVWEFMRDRYPEIYDQSTWMKSQTND